MKLAPSPGTSIFAQSMCQLAHGEQLEQPLVASVQNPNMSFGQRSHLIESGEADSIHSENTALLRSLGEQAVLEERARLLDSIDPHLVQFLKLKRQAKSVIASSTAPSTDPPTGDDEMAGAGGGPGVSADFAPQLDVLADENSKNWLNFNVVEPKKLEWMRDLPAKLPKLKPGEQYEARFDWKGVLLPFSEESSASTGVELYLHGDAAQRPGYTLQELFRLARSTVVQQRVSALGSINGILSIYNQGYYDGIFELPISKIFFLLRYAFDDNTPAMLEVSAKALATLLYNETDEVQFRAHRIPRAENLIVCHVIGACCRCCWTPHTIAPSTAQSQRSRSKTLNRAPTRATRPTDWRTSSPNSPSNRTS